MIVAARGASQVATQAAAGEFNTRITASTAVREGRVTRPDLHPAARGFAEHTLTPAAVLGRPLTTTRWRRAAAALTANTGSPG